MNDTNQTLIRSVLKIGAGYLIAKGVTSEQTTEIIIAGILAAVGVVWGIVNRRPQLPAEPPPPRSTAPLMLWLLVLSLSTAGVGLVSCSSTPARVAYNTVNAPSVAVDQAMIAWGDYVKQFHPGVADELKVKAAFERYQKLALVALDAAQSYATLAGSGNTNSIGLSMVAELASNQAATALTDLLALLQSFGIKTN